MEKVLWTELKSYISGKPFKLQYVIESDLNYIIHAQNGEFQVFAVVAINTPKGTDQLDFENNFQASANQVEYLKLAGSSASGVSQTPVQSTTGGGLHTNLRDNTGTEAGTLTNPLRVNPTGTTTQPISAASLPLPTGASTSALQSTLNTSIGTTSEAAAATDTSTSGLNGLIKRVAQRLTSIFTALSDGTQQSRIRGATTSALIGNVGDRLKVISAPSALGNLFYDEANASNGGVSIDTTISTTFVTLYSYTGAGALVGFVTKLEKSDIEAWEVRVVADSVNVINLDTSLLRTIGLEDDFTARTIGVGQNGESFRFSSSGSTQPLVFNTSVQIQVRKLDGNKKFKGGLVGIIKS
jgi:hypothetical protein